MFLDTPLTLTTFEFEFHIVDGIRRSVLARLLLLGDELFSECVIVGFGASFVYHDFLLVVGDLVDDVLGTAAAEFQLIESRDAVRVDRESARMEGLERSGGAREMDDRVIKRAGRTYPETGYRRVS